MLTDLIASAHATRQHPSLVDSEVVVPPPNASLSLVQSASDSSLSWHFLEMAVAYLSESSVRASTLGGGEVFGWCLGGWRGWGGVMRGGGADAGLDLRRHPLVRHRSLDLAVAVCDAGKSSA